MDTADSRQPTLFRNVGKQRSAQTAKQASRATPLTPRRMAALTQGTVYVGHGFHPALRDHITKLHMWTHINCAKILGAQELHLL